MKTLDEVIDLMEGADFIDWGADALHYLKEYRETKKHLACLDAAEIRGDNTQVVNNPPLTWEELKQMEGKPVWVESTNKAMHDWFLVDYTIEDDNEDIVWLVTGYAERVCLHEKTCGKHWQAYRKEK